MSDSLNKLAERLGYHFNSPDLLNLALTHRSVSRNKNNERLEFLGDAWLDQVISTFLYQRFPEATEGQLTRMRASLVKGEMLANLARELGLGSFLSLGQGEMKSGGRRRDSILADAMEAVIGAIVIDGGVEQLTPLVMQWYGSRLEELDPQQADKDAKTLLQEWLQGRGYALPVYQVVAIHGQAPQQQFDVLCEMEHDQQFRASGSSRRRAEQKAARMALDWIQEQTGD